MLDVVYPEPRYGMHVGVFLLYMQGLMQCKHTYMYVRYYREISLTNDLVLLRVRGCGCRTCGPGRKRSR